MIPPIVRLTDSQIQLVDDVVSKVLHAIQNGGCVGKQIGPGWLRVDKQALFPDLDI